jgi:hypothetical protein
MQVRRVIVIEAVLPCAVPQLNTLVDDSYCALPCDEPGLLCGGSGYSAMYTVTPCGESSARVQRSARKAFNDYSSSDARI